jgi:hypothetical protein
MIVSNSNGLSYLRENFKAKIKENGSYLDIWFNYCGEDIWIAIPKDKLIGETSVTYDFPLDMVNIKV